MPAWMRPPAGPRRFFLLSRTDASPADSRIWWLSFVSFAGFVLETRYGMPAMAICLGVWIFYIAAWPRRCLEWVQSCRLLWLLPGFATISALWSIEPSLSFKLGIEFMVFTGVAIVAGRAQTQHSLISSLMCALLVGVVLSALSRTTAPVGTTGEIALIGIFGSKNNLACFTCLSMLSSLSVLSNPRQPSRLRLLALFGLVLDPAMLIKAHSLGALLAGGGAMAAELGFVVIAQLPRRQRNLLLALLGILAAAAAGLVLLALQQGFDLSSLLAAAGKDTSLTGRTFLWSRARDMIAMRPVLGVGYQAFWVQGHIEAEGLWRFAQIESRSGFHFHNLYFETAVELGEVGAGLLAISLFATSVAAFRAGLERPGADTAFLCALVVFFAIRVGVELDFLDPFSPGSLLLPIVWIHARHYGIDTSKSAARTVYF